MKHWNNNYFLSLKGELLDRRLLLIFLAGFLFCIGFFAVLPSFLQSQTTYAAAGAEGGACINGWTGTCRDRNNYSCSGSWVEGSYPWPCPYSGNSIWCCVPAPPPPTNVTASCSPAGTAVTVNWTQRSGYPYYYARIHDETTNTQGLYSGVITGSSFSFNSAIPGHRYSYWVHTTTSSGSPYSAEVPTAHTASVTCTPPPCGDATTPPGSVVSTGVAASASTIYGNNAAVHGPANLVDGVISASTYWNSGTYPPGWVELNLGSKQTITGLKIIPRENAISTTQIYTGQTANPTTLRRTLNTCTVTAGQPINVVLPIALNDQQYIRVLTSAGDHWAAWTELSVYGSAPQTQSDTPGIIFSGGGTTDFGRGNVSTHGWVVGGATYAEEYPTNTRQSETSYQFLVDKITAAGIPFVNLTSVSGCSNLANCTLPANLPNAVYQANGNLTLNGYTFPPNKNYIFLIDGDLRILGNIVVPNGSTAFFSSSNDINIASNVGTNTNLFPLPAGQVQGIYSADRNFNIEGINDCVVGKDRMLNFEGSIITNAYGNGGTFRAKRDLCGDNPNYPSLTVRLRLDFLLNLPEILMKRSTTFSEDAP